MIMRQSIESHLEHLKADSIPYWSYSTLFHDSIRKARL
jgi:hypothetical protein